MWVMNEQEYYDKVYGGWLGKNIGGTLGAPVEGRKALLDLVFYPKLAQSGPLPNDDLDLQLVWLHALEQYGARLTAAHLGQEWVDHVLFPYDEYGYALANLRRGLVPPVSGWFGNPFSHCMGSPIRSEIWAMVAPGIPELAAHYAMQDAVVDHAGGEGVWGEVFFAALESAAFIDDNCQKLIEIGLSQIPADSRVAQAVRATLHWHAEGLPWQEARARILADFGCDNFTDAPQNIAFTILGWLYGADFGDALLTAVNCGYDTDCTGATLGAIFGIIGGRRRLPQRWVDPIGDRVVLSSAIIGMEHPTNLDQLTRKTMAAAKEVLAAWRADLALADLPTSMPGTPIGFARERLCKEYNPKAYTAVLPAGGASLSGLSVEVNTGDDGPAVYAGEAAKLHFTVRNHSTAAWEGVFRLLLPADWQSLGPDNHKVNIAAGKELVWEPAFRPQKRVDATNTVWFAALRNIDGRPWSAAKFPITLVAKWAWTVSAPNGKTVAATFPNGYLPLEECLQTTMPGIYQAQTELYSPKEQQVRLIVACSQPLQVELNGSVIIDDASHRLFMPAYHRPAQGTAAVMNLAAGVNTLRIAISKAEQPLQVVVAFTSPTPGLQHAQIDLLVG